MASRIVETLITVFKVDAKNAVSSLEGASKGIQNVSNVMKTMAQRMGNSIRFFNLLSSVVNKSIFEFGVLAGAVTAFAGKALTEFGKVQGMKNSLEDMLGSATKAKEIFNKLEDISFDSGIADMKELVDHFNQFNSLLNAPEWTVSLLRIFSEEAKRAGKDTNDLTNGLDIVKRALETGVLENRGINRLQTQFPDINKAMISHFGTDDFQTLLGQGKDMVQIFHGIMIEFDKLPKSADKFRDVWKRFTGELDLAFAKFGEQLAVVVLPLIKEVSSALQFMFRNLDMTGFTKMSEKGLYEFRDGLAGLTALFLQLPSIIQMISGVLTGLVHDILMFGVAAQYLWDILKILNPFYNDEKFAKKVYENPNWQTEDAEHFSRRMHPGSWRLIDELEKASNALWKSGKESFSPSKMKDDKNKILNALNSGGIVGGTDGIPSAPRLSTNPQLSEITRWTRETAENTKDLQETLLGGGNLAAMKVSPMELHNFRNSSNPLQEAVGKIAEYVIQEMMQVNISRVR